MHRWIDLLSRVWVGMLFFWGNTASVAAQPAPLPDAVDSSHIARDFVLHRVSPPQDRHLAFEVAIRADWFDVAPRGPEQTENYTDPILLGAWRAPGHGPVPQVAIGSLLLPLEMAADEVLERVAARVPYRVLHRQAGECRGRLIAEMLVGYEVSGVPHLQRIAAIPDGERIFFVMANGPASTHAAAAADFAAAILSFRPTDPAPDPPMSLDAWRLDAPFGVEFAVPEAWQVESGRSLSGQGVVYLRPPEAETPFVALRVHAAARETGIHETRAAEMALDWARNAGFRTTRILLELPVRIEFVPAGGFLLVQGRDSERDMELRIFTFTGKQGVVTVAGYAPPRHVWPEGWRQSRQAIQAIVENLRLE